jgi:hypothetical protein
MELFIDNKSRTKDLAYSEKNLFPIVPADRLLSSIQYAKLLNDIEKQINISQKLYHSLYKNLIDNFAEFVQILPIANHGKLGGLLSDGLQRAYYVLQKQDGDDELDSVWKYALFSAALLFNVAKVNEDRTVIISDKDGCFVRKWLSYEGAMTNDAKYYKIRHGGGMSAALGRRMTPLIASNLMPDSGFKLIAEKPQVLNAWLAILNDEYWDSGKYASVLNKVYERLRNFTLQKEFFVPVAVDATSSEKIALGEEFIEWFKESLQKGDVTVNKTDSKMHLITQGLLLEIPGVFQDFCNHNKLNIDWSVVVKQFGMLGFIPYDGKNYKIIQYETKKTISNLSLFAIKKAANDEAMNSKRMSQIGTYPNSTHIKNGVLLTHDAIEWLVRSEFFDFDDNIELINFDGNEQLEFELLTLLLS